MSFLDRVTKAVGDGEAVDAVSGGADIIKGFRFGLVGQNPLNVDAIFERLRTSGIFAGAQAGQYVAALSGVEIALWDLAGKCSVRDPPGSEGDFERGRTTLRDIGIASRAAFRVLPDGDAHPGDLCSP